jgi:hypothetical protein
VKSAWVVRTAPRSSPTTRRPAAASSLAMMLPAQPMPMTTASTGFSRAAVIARRLL